MFETVFALLMFFFSILGFLSIVAYNRAGKLRTKVVTEGFRDAMNLLDRWFKQREYDAAWRRVKSSDGYDLEISYRRPSIIPFLPGAIFNISTKKKGNFVEIKCEYRAMSRYADDVSAFSKFFGILPSLVTPVEDVEPLLPKNIVKICPVCGYETNNIRASTCPICGSKLVIKKKSESSEDVGFKGEPRPYEI